MAEQARMFTSPHRARERAPDPDALDFTAIYERHQQGVYRYVLARVGHVEDAEDITAQIFVKAYENAAEYRQDAPFAHWLYRIARNHITDFYRTHRQHTPLSAEDELPSQRESVESTLEKEQRLKRVAAALNALSEDRREALSMRLFAGLSNQEIAGIMGKSADAVAMLVYRGVQALKDRLGSEENIV